MFRLWSPGGDTILGGDPRKAAGKSQGWREEGGGCRKGKCGNGKKDGEKESGGSAPERKGIPSTERRLSWELRGKVLGGKAHGRGNDFCGPFGGHLTREKADWATSKKEEKLEQANMFGKDDIQGGKKTE